MKNTESPFRDDAAARRTMAIVLEPKHAKELLEIFSVQESRMKNSIKIKQQEMSYNYGANFIKICSILYKVSKASEEFEINYDQLESCADSLSDPATLEIFTRIYPEAQLRFIEKYGLNNTVIARTYLRTLELMKTIPVQDLDSSFPAIQRLLHSTTKSPKFYEFLSTAAESTKNGPRSLDFSIPSSEFTYAMSNYNKLTTPMGRYKETILIFWRALFGEKPVLQLLQSFEAENIYIDSYEMISILEDWETHNNLPPSWIMETFVKENRILAKAKRK